MISQRTDILTFFLRSSSCWCKVLQAECANFIGFSTLAMKRRFLSVWVLLTASMFVLGQPSHYNTQQKVLGPAVQCYPGRVSADWMPSLQRVEMPDPAGSLRGRLMALKQQAKMEKALAGNKTSKLLGSRNVQKAEKPIQRRNFQGNPYNFRVPNDNDLAISNDGKLISVINSTIMMYDVEADTLQQVISLDAFAAGLGLSGSKFDPKVVYDPVADRFILVCLNGSLDSTSMIIIGFSQTNNPAEGWNVYALDGNPVNNQTWSDYPVIGISTEELFVAVNTFTNGSQNNSGFTESTFWQIDKSKGYSGDSLVTRYYYDMKFDTNAYFNITPIKGGSGPYGPNMFLLSNRNLAIESDSFFLFEVDNTIANGGQLTISTLISPVKYALPPAARQKPQVQPFDTIYHTFDTNDSRILGGFLQDNKIQFVQSTLVPETSYAGVYHGIIDQSGTSPTIDAVIIGDSTLDYGYPNISYSGFEPDDQEAIININHTSPEVFSGCSALFVNNDGEYSDLAVLKDGESFVDIIIQNNDRAYERWGDYSGSQRKYNEKGMVWIAGSWGSLFKNRTWISEVQSPDSLRIPDTPGPVAEAFVYPNPSRDMVSIDFELTQSQVINIELFDLNGRLIKTLMNEHAGLGRYLFSFSSAPLATGMYIIQVMGEQGLLISEKFLRQ